MTATSKAPCDVLVVGEYFCDMIFSGLSDVPQPGAEFFAEGLSVRPGGCYTSALALTRLGIASAWAADFGTDIFSRIVLSEAEQDGIDARAFHRLDVPAQRVSAAFSHRGERHFSAASGLAGGSEGAMARSVIRRAEGGEEVIPSKIVTVLRSGDRVVVETAGGGGYGPASARSTERVATDLRNGKISDAAARDIYGAARPKGGRAR